VDSRQCGEVVEHEYAFEKGAAWLIERVVESRSQGGDI
jgi:hypothetical protein